MSILTILLFFIYTYGLGFTVTRFVKNSENFLERNLMRIGIGLGVFIILGLFLNLVHIPLDWKIFLVLSLVFPLYAFFKSVKKKELTIPKFRLTKSNLNIIIVLVLFIFLLSMYAGGAFKYPYLENDDPWEYAKGVKYVAIEKTLNEPLDIEAQSSTGIFRYLDPYPPAYTLVMGVLHQTSSSISWTLKFFNALIISLGIIFFYFFAKEFIGSKNKALFSTFVLAMIPCFLSHFIWSHSLIIILFFVAMYCLEQIKHDKKFMYVSGIVIGSILITQPSQAIKLSIMFGLYFIIKCILQKKFLKNIFFAGIIALLLSAIWWFNNWQGLFARIEEKGLVSASVASSGIFSVIKKILPNIPGTADRAYTFNDFFIAKSQNMINNPVGVGIFLCLLLFISLIYICIKYKTLIKEENQWIIITLFWLLFIFLGVNSVTFNLPVQLFAFRFWMLFAICVALLAPIGMWFLLAMFKKYRNVIVYLWIIIIVGVVLTSGYQKYSLNTAMWPPGGSWTSIEELQGHIWLKTLPIDTKVFKYSRGKIVMGFDKYSCEWCSAVINFRKDLINKDVTELHSWLKQNNYEYFVMSGMDYKYLGRQFGENVSKEHIPKRLDETLSSNLFQSVHQTKGAVVFKVI